MKYGLVAIDIVCCILYALMAIANQSIIYTICSACWGACAVLNYITYFKKNN